MRRTLPVLAAALLLLGWGCSRSVDYDIEEVAPKQHVGGDHDHHHGHEGEHAHHDCDHDAEAVSGSASSMHVHEAGVRNHGTEWFFNQPWAARFIWGKLARDSAVLLLLAGAVMYISRLAGRRWRR